MLKHKLNLHQIQYKNIRLSELSPQSRVIIEAMQDLIEDLIKDNKELEQALREENTRGINGVGNI